MAEFPYVIGNKKLKDFFKKIQEAKEPEKGVSQSWLRLMGFKSKNDRSFLKVLPFIGFVDDSKRPTPTWRAYRNTTRAGKVMAEAIRQGYAELFAIHPKAYNSTDDELKGFFREKTGKDDAMAGRIMLTFKTVCELADFESVGAKTTPSKPEEPPAGDTPETSTPSLSEQAGSGVPININIQLTLPETKDAGVYDNFFKALKKHLLTPEEK